MLRMFWRGCSSFDLVGNDSICDAVSPSSRHLPPSREPGYHLYRGISQVDELRKHFAFLSSAIELCGIPQGEHCPDQLRKALGPCPVWIRFPACEMSATVRYLRAVGQVTYVNPGRLASGNIPPGKACFGGCSGK